MNSFPLPFKKMHGLGNDFIMLNGNDLPSLEPELLSELAKRVCHRNFGIGADGLIISAPPTNPHVFDIRFIYLNNDGSYAEMCGNGIRCFARYVYEMGIMPQKKFRVETGAGLIEPELLEENQVKVNMGVPRLEAKQIPFIEKTPYQAGKESARLEHAGGIPVWLVNMGNPHAVIFEDALKDCVLDPAQHGPAIEVHPQFPAKTNVEFAKVTSPQTIELVVWERGCGFTLACGTGACATAVSAILSNRSIAGETVHIDLPGGRLHIDWSGHLEAPVWMTGPADYSCEGMLAESFISHFTSFQSLSN